MLERGMYIALNGEYWTFCCSNLNFPRHIQVNPQVAFAGGKWGRPPQAPLLRGPRASALRSCLYEFVKLYSPINWKC
jgi:hypothetical protein